MDKINVLNASTLTRRQWLRHACALSVATTSSWAWAQNAEWSKTVQAAKGQTVYFNAWAGSEPINAYVQWAAETVQKQFGITLKHVKITDAADVVKRVRAEKVAQRPGTVDLVWINGENFATMKRENLLLASWAEKLPNFALVDTQGKPTTKQDFSVPTEGLEAPWGMAQLTFFADARRLPQGPQNMAQLLQLAKQNPGRITYPRLPNFMGTTFIKQALLETTSDIAALGLAYNPSHFDRVTAGLWSYLDQLHPHLWRSGQQFAQSPAAMRQMMADGELLLAFTFNPNEAATEIQAQRLPSTVYSWQFERGTLGNTHFVTIPVNAQAPAAAQVVANFLMSPVAQARKAQLQFWGDPTILDISRLSPTEQAAFKQGLQPGQLSATAPTLPEPHASWVEPIEAYWLRRYAR